MKLITFECPYCSAQLQINSELKQAQCNYCGKSFVLENELENSFQSGYEFEQGRQAAQNDSVEDLAEKVGALIKPLRERKKLLADEKRLKSEINNLRRREMAASSSFGRIFPYITSGAIVMLGIALAITSKSWLILLLSIVGAGVYYISSYSQRKSLISQLPEKLEKYDSVCGQLNAIEENYDFDIIPPDYRRDEPLNFIYRALSNQRVASIRDAINLYEEEKYREEMKAMQERQIEAQNRQAKVQERQLELQRQQLEEEKANKPGGLTMDGVLTAGSLIATGITIAKALKKK